MPLGLGHHGAVQLVGHLTTQSTDPVQRAAILADPFQGVGPQGLHDAFREGGTHALEGGRGQVSGQSPLVGGGQRLQGLELELRPVDGVSAPAAGQPHARTLHDLEGATHRGQALVGEQVPVRRCVVTFFRYNP